MNNSATLVNRFLEGDKTAFDQLIANHYGYCLAKATYIVKDQELAKDLTQDALIQAFTNIEKLKDTSAFKAWLGGIVRNVCNSYLRSNKIYTKTLDDEPQHLSDNGHSEEEEQRTSLQYRLQSAINKLKNNQKEVVNAFYFEGKTIEEIATLKDINISTVKVRLFRARKQLRTLMNITNCCSAGDNLMNGHVYVWHKNSHLIGNPLVWNPEKYEVLLRSNHQVCYS